MRGSRWRPWALTLLFIRPAESISWIHGVVGRPDAPRVEPDGARAGVLFRRVQPVLVVAGTAWIERPSWRSEAGERELSVLEDLVAPARGVRGERHVDDPVNPAAGDEAPGNELLVKLRPCGMTVAPLE